VGELASQIPNAAAGSRVARAAATTNQRACHTAAGKLTVKNHPKARRVRGRVP
jgi:hypothetical protein